MKKAQKKY